MAGKGPAGVIRGGRKVAAKPVVAPRSSVRVIRPNRPAMRPGPAPDRGKISEYVGAVRGARRRLSSAKPGSANAAEAKQGLKDNRRALSRRIQRERGARRGLKPATSQQVLTGTVPAPPARRAKAARPSGTLAKPRGIKPGAIAARKAKAAASGARAARATTNYNRAQKAALEAQQRVNRRRSPKNLAAADRAQKTLQTAARAYRILVGLGGEKMAVARKPSPKGAGPRMKAARPVGTVAKPKGLKPGAIAARKARAGAGRQGQRQRAEARAIANYNRSIKAQPETKKQAGRAAIGQVTATRAVEFLRGVKRIGPQRGMTSRVLPKGFVPQPRPGVPAPSPQPQPDRKLSSGSQKPKRKTAAQKPTRSPSRLPQETRSALREIAGRRVQAEQALTGQIQKLGGITKQQAQAVFSYYSKRKFIKSQGIDGVGVKSGNLLDKDTIRQALQLAQEPAQPRKPRRR
jgi:hypothetical protein